MRVLVTGGAGFIGAHACKALAQAGHEPVAVDNLRTGHDEAVRWGPFEQGDIDDRAWLGAVFERWRPEAAMHFAALAYVGESNEIPEAYYRTNVAGTVNLLEAMRGARCRHLVFSSSCATYGAPHVVPIREDAPQLPLSPYGSSKLMAERIIADCRAAYGIQCVALRYFNAAGADPDGELGEDHDPETHLIPLALLAAAGRGPPLTVFGIDYPTPDGTCVRDYVHVSDIAQAHVLALTHCVEQGSARFNLGSENGLSVREILSTVEAVTGRPVPHRIGPRRPGDPARLVADATAAREVLGWCPRYRAAEPMVAHAWNWLCRAQ